MATPPRRVRYHGRLAGRAARGRPATGGRPARAAPGPGRPGRAARPAGTRRTARRGRSAGRVPDPRRPPGCLPPGRAAPARPGLANRPRRRRPAPLPSLSAKIAAATAVSGSPLGVVTTRRVLRCRCPRRSSGWPTMHPACSVRLAAIAASTSHSRPPGQPAVRTRCAAQCAAYARAQASGFQAGDSAARRARIRRELATAAGGADRISAYCARRGQHPIAAVPITPRHHVRCARAPWSSWSMHPRPSFTPTVRPTVWPVASGAVTRHPVLDPTRCGLHWRWPRWRLRHQHRTGGPHSPSPSAPPRTGEPGHHRIRVRVPNSGRSPAPQSSPQSRLGHTTARPAAHSSPAVRHAAKLARPVPHAAQATRATPPRHAARTTQATHVTQATPRPGLTTAAHSQHVTQTTHASRAAHARQSGQSAQLSGGGRT